MSALSNKITGEPVRAYVYTVIGAILAVLIAYGVVSADVVPIILAAASAVLAVPAVEVARSKVSPVADASTEATQ